MKKFLLATSAIVALAARVQFGRAADVDTVGYADFPTTFISFEGGYYFNASSENVDFDNEDSKLGDLGSLQPGENGWQGRFELGQRINEDWDYKVGFSGIFLDSDTTSSDIADASQTTNLQILDLEAGYRTDDLGAIQTRIFAGIRGLHSTTETSFDAADKVGEFNDEVFAAGPRIGIDLAVPLETHDIAFVGSASGSLLFGNINSEASFLLDTHDLDSNDSQTIWNVEGMAGVSFGVGENADFTLGYRVAQFGDLAVDRSDIEKTGDFSKDGHSDLLLHGPFARLTVEIP